MAAKLPWMPFYGRDFFDDEKVESMTHAQVGMYLRLLKHQWLEGSIPSDYSKMQLKLHCLEEAFESLVNEHDDLRELACSKLRDLCDDVIEMCFVPHPTIPGRLINTRLEILRIEQEKKDEKKHRRAVEGGRKLQASLKQAKAIANSELKLANQNQSQNKNKKENWERKETHLTVSKEKKACRDSDKVGEIETEFDQFWAAYPNKIGKKDAQKAWDKAADRPAITVILTAIAAQMKCRRWREGFIPNPATWINQGRWADVPHQPVNELQEWANQEDDEP